MTHFCVGDFTLSYFQNQWTNFDNFCIIVMRNQCYVLCCKTLKIAESIHVTHFREVGSNVWLPERAWMGRKARKCTTPASPVALVARVGKVALSPLPWRIISPGLAAGSYQQSIFDSGAPEIDASVGLVYLALNTYSQWSDGMCHCDRLCPTLLLEELSGNRKCDSFRLSFRFRHH